MITHVLIFKNINFFLFIFIFCYFRNKKKIIFEIQKHFKLN